MRIPAKSNTSQSGAAGGTMGGKPTSTVGSRPGRRVIQLGDEMYLWILVLIEVALIGWLRQQFRRHHGG